MLGAGTRGEVLIPAWLQVSEQDLVATDVREHCFVGIVDMATQGGVSRVSGRGLWTPPERAARLRLTSGPRR